MSTPNNSDEPAFPYGQVSELTGHPINGFFNAGLTARQYAAIHLRVPMADEPWLDAMITEARRWDAAQAALPSYSDQMRGDAVSNSVNDAEALIESLKGGAK